MSDATKSSEVVPIPGQSTPLRPPSDELANRINAAHEEVKNSLRRGVEHAIEAGKLLLQTKDTIGHGEFLEWIGENCSCTVRMRSCT